MYQVVVMWNLTRPDQELSENIKNIRLRGYNEETFITGEFAWKLAEEKIRPLSVSDVSDRYCPTRRDLYFRKGVNRLRGKERGGRDTWGSKVGNLVEEYSMRIIGASNILTTPKFCNIIKVSDRNHDEFITYNNNSINELEEIEIKTSEESGNTEWLIKLLKSNGRAEFAFQYLNKILKEKVSVDRRNILYGGKSKIDLPTKKRKEHIKQIGINLPASPDFIIPKYGIVGDIKTGVEFKSHFQLTCTGYALAYENVNGKGNDINWGIIYFFPTRNPGIIRKSITFAQIYIFPIDDYLRKEFLTKRDEAYSIISKEQEPPFPEPHEREHCYYCKFVDICKREGLDLENRNK